MPQTRLFLCFLGPSLTVFFGLGVFLAARQSPLWVRCSCLLIAVMGAAYAALCFRLEFYRPMLPWSPRLSPPLQDALRWCGDGSARCSGDLRPGLNVPEAT